MPVAPAFNAHPPRSLFGVHTTSDRSSQTRDDEFTLILYFKPLYLKNYQGKEKVFTWVKLRIASSTPSL